MIIFLFYFLFYFLLYFCHNLAGSNVTLNIFNILQNLFIRNNGITLCRFCRVEHKVFSLSGLLILVSLLLGQKFW
jgi:hypothetical protein